MEKAVLVALVKNRIGSGNCPHPRTGRYRLAVMAEGFGADALLVDVLGAISSTCLRNKEKHPGPPMSGIPA